MARFLHRAIGPIPHGLKRQAFCQHRDTISKTGYFGVMGKTSSKQSQPAASSLKGRGSAGRTLPAEFVARQFKKGQSGNPSGNRGAAYGEIVKLARQFSERAVRRLGELMESDDERVALMAAQALLDRGFGRPREFVDLSPVDASDAAERRRKLWAVLVAGLDAMAAAKALGR
jgi:hypothetical protein